MSEARHDRVGPIHCIIRARRQLTAILSFSLTDRFFKESKQLVFFVVVLFCFVLFCFLIALQLLKMNPMAQVTL